MKIVSVINYKGGVGKTTATANIAAELAHRGRRVLMIDLDPQASLTFSFVTPQTWRNDLSESKTIRNWFIDGCKVDKFQDLIITPQDIVPFVQGQNGKLDLVASHLDLINVDLQLVTQLSGVTARQIQDHYINVHHRLADGIAQLGSNEYDIVLIDCPPNFNIVTKNAIVACEKILLPAKPDYLSTLGIDYLLRSVNQLVKDYNGYCDENNKINPTLWGIVFTMVQYYRNKPIGALRQFIARTKTLYPIVFDNMIRENKSVFSDTGLYSTPVAIMKPGIRPHIVKELEALVTEFESKL